MFLFKKKGFLGLSLIVMALTLFLCSFAFAEEVDLDSLIKRIEQKDPKAYLQVGDLLFNGGTIKQDKASAVKWYKMAAEGGVVEAYRKLGDLYFEGVVVSKDLDEAYKWYEKAFKAGDLVAGGRLKQIELLKEKEAKSAEEAKVTKKVIAGSADIENIVVMKLTLKDLNPLLNVYKDKQLIDDFTKSYVDILLNFVDEKGDFGRWLLKNKDTLSKYESFTFCYWEQAKNEIAGIILDGGDSFKDILGSFSKGSATLSDLKKLGFDATELEVKGKLNGINYYEVKNFIPLEADVLVIVLNERFFVIGKDLMSLNAIVVDGAVKDFEKFLTKRRRYPEATTFLYFDTYNSKRENVRFEIAVEGKNKLLTTRFYTNFLDGIKQPQAFRLRPDFKFVGGKKVASAIFLKPAYDTLTDILFDKWKQGKGMLDLALVELSRELNISVDDIRSALNGTISFVFGCNANFMMIPITGCYLLFDAERFNSLMVMDRLLKNISLSLPEGLVLINWRSNYWDNVYALTTPITFTVAAAKNKLLLGLIDPNDVDKYSLAEEKLSIYKDREYYYLFAFIDTDLLLKYYKDFISQMDRLSNAYGNPILPDKKVMLDSYNSAKKFLGDVDYLVFYGKTPSDFVLKTVFK